VILFVMYDAYEYEGYGSPNLTTSSIEALDYLNSPSGRSGTNNVDKYELKDNKWELVNSYSRRHHSCKIEEI
jgi:hypothetical protein